MIFSRYLYFAYANFAKFSQLFYFVHFVEEISVSPRTTLLKTLRHAQFFFTFTQVFTFISELLLYLWFSLQSSPWATVKAAHCTLCMYVSICVCGHQLTAGKQQQVVEVLLLLRQTVGLITLDFMVSLPLDQPALHAIRT